MLKDRQMPHEIHRLHHPEKVLASDYKLGNKKYVLIHDELL